MFKVSPIVQDMYDHLKAVGKKEGIQFKKLELASVARELGLLDQIELNFPSREVRSVINVEFPDPNNLGQSKVEAIEHVSRVLMTDDEVVVYRREQAARLLAEHYGISVDALNAQLEGHETMANAAKPKVKNPPKQKSSMKPGKQDPGKKAAGGPKKSSVKKPVK